MLHRFTFFDYKDEDDDEYDLSRTAILNGIKPQPTNSSIQNNQSIRSNQRWSNDNNTEGHSFPAFFVKAPANKKLEDCPENNYGVLVKVSGYWSLAGGYWILEIKSVRLGVWGLRFEAKSIRRKVRGSSFRVWGLRTASLEVRGFLHQLSICLQP